MTYKERDLNLISLGFLNYKVYLGSELWKEIKRRVLTKSIKCEGCNRLATLLHHSDYDIKTLLGEVLTELHPICKACHCRIEFRANGSKTSLTEANQRLNLLKKKPFKRKPKLPPHQKPKQTPPINQPNYLFTVAELRKGESSMTREGFVVTIRQETMGQQIRNRQTWVCRWAKQGTNLSGTTRFRKRKSAFSEAMRQINAIRFPKPQKETLAEYLTKRLGNPKL